MFACSASGDGDKKSGSVSASVWCTLEQMQGLIGVVDGWMKRVMLTYYPAQAQGNLSGKWAPCLLLLLLLQNTTPHTPHCC